VCDNQIQILVQSSTRVLNCGGLKHFRRVNTLSGITWRVDPASHADGGRLSRCLPTNCSPSQARPLYPAVFPVEFNSTARCAAEGLYVFIRSWRNARSALFHQTVPVEARGGERGAVAGPCN
jgi:hypothetical protein